MFEEITLFALYPDLHVNDLRHPNIVKDNQMLGGNGVKTGSAATFNYL